MSLAQPKSPLDALQAIRQHEPRIKLQHSRIRAAVCLILREGNQGTEILLMQRAHHKNDPWSGQMAFPGGKIETSDAGPKEAAMRETLEEVGLDMADAQYLGQLNDIYGFKLDGVYVAHISTFVFWLKQPVTIVPNYEVGDTVWLPFAWMDDPQRYMLYASPRAGMPDMPAVRINLDKQQILWGLTLRIIVHFFDLIDHPIRVFDAQICERIRQVERDEE